MSNQKEKDSINFEEAINEATKIPEVAEAAATINISQSDLAKQIAEAFLIAQAAQRQMQSEEEAKKALEQKMRTADRSGLASINLTQRIEEEIKRGEYTNFKYWPSLADKYGDYKTIGVGYQINFVRGMTTPVPNSLMHYVEKEFGEDKQNPIRNIMVTDPETHAIDTVASQQAASGVQNWLAASGYRFR